MKLHVSFIHSFRATAHVAYMTAMVVSAVFANSLTVDVIFCKIACTKNAIKQENQTCTGKIAPGQELQKGKTTFTFG